MIRQGQCRAGSIDAGSTAREVTQEHHLQLMGLTTDKSEELPGTSRGCSVRWQTMVMTISDTTEGEGRE